MKKICLLIILTILLTGCGGEVDLVGTWNSSNQSTYTFNSDGTCEKRNTVSIYPCTYDRPRKGVVDIYLTSNPSEVHESGQINPDRIIIGSEVYKKGD